MENENKLADGHMVRGVACALVNELWLKIPPTTGPKTRTEASRPWIEVLDGKGLGIIYDENAEVFVLAENLEEVPASLEEIPEAIEPSDNGDGKEAEAQPAAV